MSHLQPFEKVLVSADTIVEASRKLQLAQTTMNHIEFTRRTESPEIAAHLTRVMSLMSDLVSLLKELPHFQGEALRPMTVPTQLSLSIDVVSRAQVERVFRLIGELEQTLSQTLELQSSQFDGLADHLAFIRRPAESEAVDVVRSDELARLQDEQLRTLQSIIESLPDSIEIPDDVPLAPFEIPVLALPKAAPKVLAASDPIRESNLHLIEQIEKHKFELEELPVAAGERPLVTDGTQKLLDDLTKAMEVTNIDIGEMEATRRELLAKLADAQRKLDAAVLAAPEKTMEELREKLQQREMEVEKREAQLVELGKIRAKVMPLLDKTRTSLASCEREYRLMKQNQARLKRIEDDIRSVKIEQDELAELVGLKDEQAVKKFAGT
jgi:DNA-binding XRE family transcriptional regulator